MKTPSILIGFVAFAILTVVNFAMASTTISTNIQTDGTLSVTGQSSLTGAVGIGTTSPVSQLDLEGRTVTTDGGTITGGNPQFQINGILDTTSTIGHVTGFQAYWNTVGVNSPNLNGVRLQLNAGYTGSGLTRVLDAQNLVAGSRRLGVSDAYGNMGANVESQGYGGTGDNIGLYAIADGAQNLNIAVFGRSIAHNAHGSLASESIGNIGVIGIGAHYLGQGTQTAIGGFFTPSANENWTGQLASAAMSSTALMLDNSTEGVPLLIGRVNGVNSFQITSTGGIFDLPSTDSTTLWQVQNATGATLFNLDSANRRVGIGTSSPLANLQVANSSSNATTTMEVGSSGQNKGSCLKMYRTDGSAIYAYVAAGATTFTLSTAACANVSGF